MRRTDTARRRAGLGVPPGTVCQDRTLEVSATLEHGSSMPCMGLAKSAPDHLMIV